MTSALSEFRPGWISPPGDTILDIIEERGWTQSELAGRLGYTKKHVSLLANGKAPITEDTALRLERVLGGSMVFWLNREAQYREKLTRREEPQRLQKWISWLEEIPVRELMDAGGITKRRVAAGEKPMIIREALAFYGVASPDEWRVRYERQQVAYRRTRKEQSDVGAISAWLRLGERAVEGLRLPAYDRARFRKNLDSIRAMTLELPAKFEDRLHAACREAGVALVLVPSIPCSHVSGAARWLGGKPVIQLSLYGKTNDRFWFTFFHEAAHILFHEKSLVFLDAPRGDIRSAQEDEANEWAGTFLIPEDREEELKALETPTQIASFAGSLGIHPGIIVGRLQYEGLLDYATPLNRYKVSFCFKDHDEKRR